MTWILSLVFRTLTLTTGSQQLLDLHGWLYVQDLHYVAIHSHTRLGKYLVRDLQRDKPKMTTCKVSKSIVGAYDWIWVLTGADRYVQICTKEVDKYYLFKINC